MTGMDKRRLLQYLRSCGAGAHSRRRHTTRRPNFHDPHYALSLNHHPVPLYTTKSAYYYPFVC